MSGAPRSLRNPRNPGQGTAFYELVVAPTFTYNLARPYHVPGSDLVLNPVVAGTNVAGAVDQTPATPEGPIELDNDTEGPRKFYVHVTLEWTERGKSTRSNARTKKMHESKLVSDPVDILSTSRVAFIPVALGAHNYDDLYVAGIASGPAMWVFWTGSPGGKGGATAVLHDKDWDIILKKLGDAMKASKKLDTISIVFDLDTMEGFKQRSKRIHSPDSYDSELSYGTRVPDTDNCTPAQIALGAAIDDIKAAHSCAQHGICFINGDLQHLEMNRFRLNSWGQAVVAGQSAAGNPPPNELLAAWTGGSTSASTSKPRGRGGPYPAQLQSGSAGDNTVNLLLTTMAAVIAMMAQNMAGNVLAPAPLAPLAPPAPPRSPVQASSPPPAIEDDLDVFMDAFRRAKNLSHALIDDAKTGLRDAHYSPDILCEASVTSERLKELTGLAEGEVHQLKKFARQWSGKMEGKRARRGIPF
ncbi:hypothetical protein B0H11DRAFT_2405873 [Mycena galericulata]|nr:hypothetical protein B0H11DRAFT_2405873 [Mycena galericulata]